jgi:hypothetical protein
MMFTKEDFKLPDSKLELIQFLPIIIFAGFVAPFLIGAYKLGFVMDISGWLKSRSY